jgi:Type-IV b secretion system, inner-membrane complex component
VSTINRRQSIVLSMLLLSTIARADSLNDTDTQLSVWANEAIVATYTYDYKNFLQRQKEIAKYFTAAGWIAYTAALNAAKLPQTVQENAFFVSSVATSPPEIKTRSAQHWQANMPLLVVYKNPQYQQRQHLNVVINFIRVPAGQGVRGLAINSLQAQESKPTCKCEVEE